MALGRREEYEEHQEALGVPSDAPCFDHNAGFVGVHIYHNIPNY